MCRQVSNAVCIGIECQYAVVRPATLNDACLFIFEHEATGYLVRIVIYYWSCTDLYLVTRSSGVSINLGSFRFRTVGSAHHGPPSQCNLSLQSGVQGIAQMTQAGGAVGITRADICGMIEERTGPLERQLEELLKGGGASNSQQAQACLILSSLCIVCVRDTHSQSPSRSPSRSHADTHERDTRRLRLRKIGASSCAPWNKRRWR